MAIDKSYSQLIESLKKEIHTSRIKAHLAVNKELILLYWKIGRRILEEQEAQGWGAKVIETISKDLRQEFPEMKGLSQTNLKYMKMFSSFYSDEEIRQQAVDQIPWGHNIAIFSNIKDHKQRLWYIQKTVENGWSRNVLIHQIESDLYARQGKAITNFSNALPSPQSDLAHQLVKSSYNLEFLDIEDEIGERKLEDALIRQIRDFLLELGSGFAFVGNQYHLELEGDDYYIDLLFYHLKLRCYVVIELKTGKFKPEYAGKLNFYLNLIDRQLKAESDNPTIGLILCKNQKGITVEHTFEGMIKPMGVSEYKVVKELEEKLTKLPATDENEALIAGRIP